MKQIFIDIVKKCWGNILFCFGLIFLGVLIASGIYYYWGFDKRGKINEVDGTVSNPNADAELQQSKKIRESVWRILKKTGVA